MYEELGEKPSGYFLNLENRNFMDKVITKLIDSDGNEYRNSDDILKLQKQYYQDLYKDELKIDEVPINELIGENLHKLNKEESDNLEGEITYEELANALKYEKFKKSWVMVLQLFFFFFFFNSFGWT